MLSETKKSIAEDKWLQKKDFKDLNCQAKQFKNWRSFAMQQKIANEKGPIYYFSVSSTFFFAPNNDTSCEKPQNCKMT